MPMCHGWRGFCMSICPLNYSIVIYSSNFFPVGEGESGVFRDCNMVLWPSYCLSKLPTCWLPWPRQFSVSVGSCMEGKRLPAHLGPFPCRFGSWEGPVALSWFVCICISDLPGDTEWCTPLFAPKLNGWDSIIGGVKSGQTLLSVIFLWQGIGIGHHEGVFDYLLLLEGCSHRPVFTHPLAKNFLKKSEKMW